MKTFLLALSFSAFGSLSSFGTQTNPFKAASVTVDYTQGRKVVFTTDMAGLGFDRNKLPKVVGVWFVFEEGKVAEVPAEALKDIQVINVQSAMIETGIGDGNWFLTARITNKEKLEKRIADDWVVLVFKNYKYESRWLERNKKRKS